MELKNYRQVHCCGNCKYCYDSDDSTCCFCELTDRQVFIDYICDNYHSYFSYRENKNGKKEN